MLDPCYPSNSKSEIALIRDDLYSLPLLVL